MLNHTKLKKKRRKKNKENSLQMLFRIPTVGSHFGRVFNPNQLISNKSLVVKGLKNGNERCLRHRKSSTYKEMIKKLRLFSSQRTLTKRSQNMKVSRSSH